MVNTDFEDPGTDLSGKLADDAGSQAYIELLENTVLLNSFERLEDYEANGLVYLGYRFENNNEVYLTVCNGTLIVFEAYIETDLTDELKSEGHTYLLTIIDSLSEEPVEADDIPESASAGKEYYFPDAGLTMTFSEDEFDVLTQDNTDNQLALERQGLTQEQADLYLSLTGYALKAVPVGQNLKEDATIITLNIKEPKYDALEDLKDLSPTEKNLMAQALISSFGLSSYDWYSTDDAEYIVFDWNNEVRYATIKQERMVYVFLTGRDGVPTEAERTMLRETVDAMRWSR